MSDHEHDAREIYVSPDGEGSPYGYLPAVIAGLSRPSLPQLDEECSCAYLADDLNPDPACGTCHGNGYVLTDAGKALLAFLQRHPPPLTRVTGD